MYSIKVTITNFSGVLPMGIKGVLENAVRLEGFNNCFEVYECISTRTMGSGVKFLCVYCNYFFTVPMEHVRKL